MATHAPALDAPGRGLFVRAAPRTVEATLLASLIATVGIVYFLLHRQLAIQSDAAYARISGFPASTHPGHDAIAYSGRFLAVVAGSLALAALRHRVAAFAIFAMAALTPVTQAVLGVLPRDRSVFFRVGPDPLGAFWTPGNVRPAAAQIWRASTIDHVLAWLPALAIVVWTVGEARGPDLRGRLHEAAASVRAPNWPAIAGLACSAGLFWLVLHTWELRETLRGTTAPTIGTDVVTFLPFLALGVVLARGSRWRFAALVAVPVLWSTAWIPNLLAGDGHGPSMDDVHEALPYLAVVAAGAAWYAIANAVNGRNAPAWVLVAALNVLNLCDVLFTSGALRSGQAVEANPVATVMGPGSKIVVVGAASLLLARFRPRALLWLVVAMSLVIAWHLSGLILDAA